MMSLLFSKTAALFLTAVFGLSLVCLAQSDTASISGFVRDQTGSVVPNASVVLKNEATLFERLSFSESLFRLRRQVSGIECASGKMLIALERMAR